MKLLIDENTSFRIVKLIEPPFKDSLHVLSCSPPLRKDVEIWEMAQKHGYTILTFDEDFSE